MPVDLSNAWKCLRAELYAFQVLQDIEALMKSCVRSSRLGLGVNLSFSRTAEGLASVDMHEFGLIVLNFLQGEGEGVNTGVLLRDWENLFFLPVGTELEVTGSVNVFLFLLDDWMAGALIVCWARCAVNTGGWGWALGLPT